MDNKLKVGIVSWCLPNKENDMCKVANSLGLEAIQVGVRYDYKTNPMLDKEYCKNLKAEAKQYNIDFTAMGFLGLMDFYMTKKEGFKEAFEFCDYLIEMAQNMGIKLLQIPNFGKSVIKTEEDFNNTVEFFKEFCDRVSEKGMIIGTENALTYQDNLRMLKEVNKENFKVYYDSQNHHTMSKLNQAEIADKLFDEIAEVHLKDGAGENANRLLGEGDSGFFETVNVLKDKGYKGYIIIENSYDKVSNGGDYNEQCELIKKDVETIRKFF